MAKTKPGPKPKRPSPSDYGKALLTAEEAAECLGESAAIVYKMLRGGSIKSLKSGRRYLIPSSTIDQIIRGM